LKGILELSAHQERSASKFTLDIGREDHAGGGAEGAPDDSRQEKMGKGRSNGPSQEPGKHEQGFSVRRKGRGFRKGQDEKKVKVFPEGDCQDLFEQGEEDQAARRGRERRQLISKDE